jgi:hypothetical protein
MIPQQSDAAPTFVQTQNKTDIKYIPGPPLLENPRPPASGHRSGVATLPSDILIVRSMLARTPKRRSFPVDEALLKLNYARRRRRKRPNRFPLWFRVLGWLWIILMLLMLAFIFVLPTFIRL